MRDPLDDVLRLVAEGRLSPEEAAPIIDALAAVREAASRARAAGSATRDAGTAAADAARAAADAARAAGFESRRPGRPGAGAPRPPGPPRPPMPPGPPRRLRVLVRDGGRTVVDLQLPGVLAELAGTVPGIPSAYVERIREALRTGVRGPIVDVTDEDGSGVTITVD
jgi:hypothetical protein